MNHSKGPGFVEHEVGVGVLAGGKALRLGDDFRGKPKALLPLNKSGVGLLAHLALSAHRHRMPIWGVVEPWTMQILRNDPTLGIVPILWVEDPGYGTAVALRRLMFAVTVPRLIVMNCDTLLPFSLAEIANVPMPKGPVRQHLTINSVQNERMIGVSGSDEDAHVVHWGESTSTSPSPDLRAASSTGVYEFNVALMRSILGAEESLEDDLMPHLVQRGDVEAIVHMATYPTFDYGTTPRYRNLRSDQAILGAYLRRMGLIS